MLCPSLGSMNDHIGWLRASGFGAIRARNITQHVEQTWARAAEILERREIALLLRTADRSMREFARAFSGIQEAYAVGAMTYGLFSAQKCNGPARDALPKTFERCTGKTIALGCGHAYPSYGTGRATRSWCVRLSSWR